MDPVLARLYDHYQSLHESCKQALSGLDTQALDWMPGEGMNSLAVLATHIAGSERFWISDITMQEPTGRDRPAEFRARDTDTGRLIELLDSSLATIRAAFERLTQADLGQPRTSPLDGKTYDVAWTIGQSLTHTALHLGHIQITRQLLDAARSRQGPRLS
jgi:uncharacterized damage-inducible protein DinB